MHRFVVSFSIPVPTLVYSVLVFAGCLAKDLWYRMWWLLDWGLMPFWWICTQVVTGFFWCWQWLTVPRPRQYPFILSPELWIVVVGMGIIYVPKWIEARRYEAPKPVAQVLSDLQQLEQVNQVPQRVVIPVLGMDLETKAATVSGNNWQLYEDAVSWLSTSGKPGEAGNTVLYAHNRAHLFGPLASLRTGSNIYVLTDHGWFTYLVDEIKYVPNTAIEEVMPTSEPQLTLYTCTNFWDLTTQRLVIKAKLQQFGAATSF